MGEVAAEISNAINDLPLPWENLEWFWKYGLDYYKQIKTPEIMIKVLHHQWKSFKLPKAWFEAWLTSDVSKSVDQPKWFQRCQNMWCSTFYQKGWSFGKHLSIWNDTSVRRKQRWPHLEGCCQISQS